MRKHRLTTSFALATSLALGAQAAVLAQEPTAGESSSVVVSTSVLGAVVDEVVGDAAEVIVLMPGGADPHAWRPSARDAEHVMEATLVVENGLNLEEGLIDVLEQARADGVDVFTAADYVEVRMSADSHDDHEDHAEHDEGEHAEGKEHEEDHGHDEHAEGEAKHDDHEEHADDGHDDHSGHDHHDHGPEDPHLWLDPVAMGSVVEALAAELAERGIDVEDRADAFTAELQALDAEIAAMMATIPEDQRQLVTGHEVLGYFTDRYGLEQVGTVIPGFVTFGETSAQNLGEVVEAMEEAGVSVLFTDLGTHQSVAEALAAETGAEVVRLNPAQMPEGGSYIEFMRELAESISGALAR